jgi:hypothetical protein
MVIMRPLVKTICNHQASTGTLWRQFQWLFDNYPNNRRLAKLCEPPKNIAQNKEEKIMKKLMERIKVMVRVGNYEAISESNMQSLNVYRDIAAAVPATIR